MAQLQRDLSTMSGGPTERHLPAGEIVGESPAILAVLKSIRRIARTDATVLIEGETGTGKELAARTIHYLGARREFPFIPINCGALPEHLIENELFGHERGAFTGAEGGSPGLLRLAHRGTLFLDEVDSLPARAQVVLLRFLQDGRFRPLGARKEEFADTRILAASNVALDDLVESNDFRGDLYYRLGVISVVLPPLRDRADDAKMLANHFIRECASRYGLPEKALHPDCRKWLRTYHWPGNVRELQNLVYRECLLSDDESIIVKPDVSENAAAAVPSLPSSSRDRAVLPYQVARSRALEEFDRRYLENVLSQARGNVTLAAKLAGKERRALGKLLKRYSILPANFRS